MFCPQCGSENPEIHEFCAQCGTSLEEAKSCLDQAAGQEVTLSDLDGPAASPRASPRPEDEPWFVEAVRHTEQLIEAGQSREEIQQHFLLAGWTPERLEVIWAEVAARGHSQTPAEPASSPVEFSSEGQYPTDAASRAHFAVSSSPPAQSPPPQQHGAGGVAPTSSTHISQADTVGSEVATHPDRAKHASANWALVLGLATIFMAFLGPLALWMGLRSRKHGGGRAVVGIAFGALGTLVLVGLIAFGGAFIALGKTEPDSGDVGGFAGMVERGIAAVAARDPAMGVILRVMQEAWRDRNVADCVALSSDQQAVIESYGYPSTFVLVADDEGTRSEIWDYYYSMGEDPFIKEYFTPQRLYFADGELLLSAMIQPVPIIFFNNYRPTQFDLASDEAQIRATMGEPTEVRELDMQEYGAATVLDYRVEIMFMFIDGRPLGVMTFVPGGTTTEVQQ